MSSTLEMESFLNSVVPPPSIKVNLDGMPSMASEVSIKKHVRGGIMVIQKRPDGSYINGKKMVLCRNEITWTFNALLAEFFYENPESYPEGWKQGDEESEVYVMFPNTVFVDGEGKEFILYTYWHNGHCRLCRHRLCDPMVVNSRFASLQF